MNIKMAKLDLTKLILFVLKRCWVIIICAEIGFGFMYWRAAYKTIDTYTASGTMYVYNVNPNMVNYGYASSSDLTTAVQLMNTYLVVVKSNKVLDVVVERLMYKYPDISSGYIAKSIYMGSVDETGVLRISCRTDDPNKSADICNAIIDVAPSEIIRVVGVGAIEIIDYAYAPSLPDSRTPLKSSLIGALIGAVPPTGVLVLLYLFNQKINDVEELTEYYNLPVLASVKRVKKENAERADFLLKSATEMEVVENYAKLRMNLLYTLAGKERHCVMVTSSISGEGKSTIAANLAISVAMSGKKVLLIDADMRRGSQHTVFRLDEKTPGLSDVLIGSCDWKSAIRNVEETETLKILPAGAVPPNPAELLESPVMSGLLAELESAYDLIVMDVPPINIVSDPLALSNQTAGGVFVVRQDYSDHREIKKALRQAEMTGLNLLGFVFYGENLHENGYYKKGYYYNSYTNMGRESSGLWAKKKKKKEKRQGPDGGKKAKTDAEGQNTSAIDLLRLYKENQAAQPKRAKTQTAESRERQADKRISEAYRKRYIANRRRRELYRKNKTRSD